MSAARILIVNLTRFGDLLQTSPVVATLRARHPGATITLLAERNFADVCDGIPGVDRVVRADLDRLGNLILEGGARLLEGYRYVEALLAELRAERFDLALNYSSSRMTAVFMGLLGIADVRGWSMTADGLRVIRHPWARLFATMCLNRRLATFNLVDYYRAMADEKGAPGGLRYEVSAPARARVDALLAEAGGADEAPLVALQLGASKAIRQWPPESFVALGQRLAARGATVVLIGGGGERPLAAAVAAAIGARVVDACGRTGVGELGALLARCALLVTGDTGPMHMACAVGTPVVGLFFGPASPHDTGPYGADHLLLHTSAPCAPCDHNVTCLQPFCREELTPALVADAVGARLAGDWGAVEALARASAPVRWYRTGFDADGRFRCQTLGEPTASAEEQLRAAYRAMWLTVLAGRPLTPAVAGGLDPSAFVALGRLARDGDTLAARLLAEARGGDGSIEEMKRLGRELEILDRTLAEHGSIHAETRVLTQMFTFGKENLEGEEVVALAGATRELYRQLVLETDCMIALLRGTVGWEPDDARLHQ